MHEDPPNTGVFGTGQSGLGRLAWPSCKRAAHWTSCPASASDRDCATRTSFVFRTGRESAIKLNSNWTTPEAGQVHVCHWLDVTGNVSRMSEKSDIRQKASMALFETEPGRPQPLGATVDKEGVNFSVFSRNATTVELLLFERQDDVQPIQIIKLKPPNHQTFFFGSSAETVGDSSGCVDW